MIPEFKKMCLRRLVKCHIPRPRDLFQRYGERSTILNIPDDAIINSQPNRKMETYELLKQEAYKSYAQEQKRLAEESEKIKAQEAISSEE